MKEPHPCGYGSQFAVLCQLTERPTTRPGPLRWMRLELRWRPAPLRCSPQARPEPRSMPPRCWEQLPTKRPSRELPERPVPGTARAICSASTNTRSDWRGRLSQGGHGRATIAEDAIWQDTARTASSHCEWRRLDNATNDRGCHRPGTPGMCDTRPVFRPLKISNYRERGEGKTENGAGSGSSYLTFPDSVHPRTITARLAVRANAADRSKDSSGTHPSRR